MVSNWSRTDFVSKLASLGGLMAIITPFFAWIYSKSANMVTYQDYVNDLYTTSQDDPQTTAQDKNNLNSSVATNQTLSSPTSVSSPKSAKQDNLPDWLASATNPVPLYYKTTTLCWDFFKGSCCCCFACLPCCKTSR